jgi:hypothetical protein
MRFNLFILSGIIGLLLNSCALMISDHERSGDKTPTGPTVSEDTVKTVKKLPFKTGTLFPFDDNTNWWRYSEVQGNQLSIVVTDTISDDGVTYYRVAFRENRVDTTDDWFKRSSVGIMFGAALSGSYNTFLPATFDSADGSFVSGNSIVDCQFLDSNRVGGVMYRNVFVLTYSRPVLHSFDQIIFADSVGIVELKDAEGRWPIDYLLDSCSIDGAKRIL